LISDCRLIAQFNPQSEISNQQFQRRVEDIWPGSR